MRRTGGRGGSRIWFLGLVVYEVIGLVVEGERWGMSWLDDRGLHATEVATDAVRLDEIGLDLRRGDSEFRLCSRAVARVGC